MNEATEQKAARERDNILRERDAYFDEAASVKETLASIIPALEIASKCNADELRATCAGSEITPDEWAALRMARAIMEADELKGHTPHDPST